MLSFLRAILLTINAQLPNSLQQGMVLVSCIGSSEKLILNLEKPVFRTS